jgi:hypothetical protein
MLNGVKHLNATHCGSPMHGEMLHFVQHDMDFSAYWHRFAKKVAMTAFARETRRALVDLLPQYLTRRMRGWAELQSILDEADLVGPGRVVLRAIVMETDPGASMSEDELRANLFNPYATLHSYLEALPALVKRGYLALDGDRYTVTPQGRALVERIERAGRAYLATLDLLPPDDLARLAETFAGIAARLWAAAEPAAKSHQARVRRLPSTEGEPAMVRLEEAVYALWMARDDAHNAAWRAGGFDGPAFDLLSRVWAGEAGAVAELTERVGGGQRPEDVERGLAALIDRGYLIAEGDALRLTAAGRAIRDAIEAETDRVYFAPWPPELADVEWVHNAFRTLCERLP